MISAAASAFENFDQLTQKKSLIGRTSLSSSGDLSIPPYEVVPESRPVIVIGPALRGYEVTDLMHKALYNYLKKRFAGRISIHKTHADIGQCKRRIRVNQNDRDKFNITKAVASKTSPEVMREVERIYELTRGLNIVIIDCDVINHPSQLTDCSLAPIIVYIRMQSGILEKLIKLRGAKKKNMGAQVLGLQKLLQCSEDQFDLILDEAIFDDACEHLGQYLEQYCRDLRPSGPDNLAPNDVALAKNEGELTEDPSKPLLPVVPSLQYTQESPMLKQRKPSHVGASGLQNTPTVKHEQRHRDSHSPRSSTQHGPSGLRAVPAVRKTMNQQGPTRQRPHEGQQRKVAITGKAPELGNIDEYDTAYQQSYVPDQYNQRQPYYNQEGQFDVNQYGPDGFVQDPQYGSESYQGYSDQYEKNVPQGYSHGYEQEYPQKYNEQTYQRDYRQGYGQNIPYQEYPREFSENQEDIGGHDYTQGYDYQQQYSDEVQQGHGGGQYREGYYPTEGYNWK